MIASSETHLSAKKRSYSMYAGDGNDLKDTTSLYLEIKDGLILHQSHPARRDRRD